MPRSVFIDLEPSVVDTIRNGEYKNLYDKRSIINEVEDAVTKSYKRKKKNEKSTFFS